MRINENEFNQNWNLLCTDMSANYIEEYRTGKFGIYLEKNIQHIYPFMNYEWSDIDDCFKNIYSKYARVVPTAMFSPNADSISFNKIQLIKFLRFALEEKAKECFEVMFPNGLKDIKKQYPKFHVSPTDRIVPLLGLKTSKELIEFLIDRNYLVLWSKEHIAYAPYYVFDSVIEELVV